MGGSPKYTEFLCYKENGELPEGQFGGHFVGWSEENLGAWIDVDERDENGEFYYKLERVV